MKPEVALAVVLTGMSDRDVLEAYRAAAIAKDPHMKQIGRELLVRLHRADLTNFPRSVLDEYDATRDPRSE